MSVLHCMSCDKALTGGIDTFGDVGEPFCWPCYSTLQREEEQDYLEWEQEHAPKECPNCHAKSLYHKDEAGYPGLYHCAHCGIWIDRASSKAWTWHTARTMWAHVRFDVLAPLLRVWAWLSRQGKYNGR